MISLSLRSGAGMASVLLGIGAGLLSGCRAPDTSALEAENRMLEDQIYELQDHCQQLHDELASARRANASQRRDRRGSAEEEVPSQLSPPSFEGMPELPSGPTGREPYLRRPEEEGEAPPYEMPSTRPSGAIPGELPPFEPMPEGSPQAFHDEDSYDELESPGADEVVSITLNRRLTGGHDRSPGGGHEGVMVVVEPRTRDGRIVPVDGDVTIGVLDPEQPASQGRIARWDFSRQESARFYRRTPMGAGLHFDLPWPAEAPPTDRVKLWVRLTTPEGRKLLAQRTVAIDSGGDPVAPASFEARREAESADGPGLSPRRAAAKPQWAPNRSR